MKTTVLYLDHTAKAGGAEFCMLRLLGALDPARVRPIVVFADEGAAPEMFRAAGLETHVIPLSGEIREVRKDTLGGPAFLHPGRALALGSYALRIRRFAKERGAGIIHTNSMKAHFYGGAAGRLAGIPVLWQIRDFIDTSYLPWPAVRLVRLLARSVPSHVVAPSQSVMDKIQSGTGREGRRSGENFSVVHDGLGESDLGDAPAPEAPGAPAAEWRLPVRVGIVGRLAAWKGQHIFVQAAAKLLKAGHQAKFLVIGAPLFGEHSYEEELRQMAVSLGIAEHVEFLGFRRDVGAVMRTLDILVHASTSADPFPNVILEGMALGLPIVGSNGGGVPEMIVDGESGRLSPMGDAGGLARSLESYLRDPAGAKAIGRAGSIRVRQHFTAARSAREIEEIYGRLCRYTSARSPSSAGPVGCGSR